MTSNPQQTPSTPTFTLLACSGVHLVIILASALDIAPVSNLPPLVFSCAAVGLLASATHFFVAAINISSLSGAWMKTLFALSGCGIAAGVLCWVVYAFFAPASNYFVPESVVAAKAQQRGGVNNSSSTTALLSCICYTMLSVGFGFLTSCAMSKFHSSVVRAPLSWLAAPLFLLCNFVSLRLTIAGLLAFVCGNVVLNCTELKQQQTQQQLNSTAGAAAPTPPQLDFDDFVDSLLMSRRCEALFPSAIINVSTSSSPTSAASSGSAGVDDSFDQRIFVKRCTVTVAVIVALCYAVCYYYVMTVRASASIGGDVTVPRGRSVVSHRVSVAAAGRLLSVSMDRGSVARSDVNAGAVAPVTAASGGRKKKH